MPVPRTGPAHQQRALTPRRTHSGPRTPAAREPGRSPSPTSRAGSVVEGQRGLAGREAPEHVGALGHGAGCGVVVHLL